MINLDKFNDLKVNDQIGDTLDTCNVNILTKTPIKYSRLGIAKFKGINWAVFAINYKTTNAGVLNEITLIEPTKNLENYIKVGMSFTDFPNLLEEIQIALVKFDVDGDIYIRADDKDRLSKAEGVDLQYDGTVILREVLDDMLATIDCAVRYDGLSFIYIEENEKRGNLIELTGLNEKENTIDAEYDVDGIIAIGNNAVGNNDISEVLVARNDKGIFDNTNGAFYSVYNMFGVSKVYTKFSYIANGTGTLASGELYTFSGQAGELIVDLTDFLYEYKEWQLLPTGKAKRGYQESSFYYTFKGKEIGGLLNVVKPNGSIFSSPVYEILQSVLAYPMDPKVKKDMEVDIESKGEFTDVSVSGFALSGKPYTLIVDYRPIFDAFVSTRKPGRFGDRHILLNYNEGQTNLDLFTKNIQGTVERIGNRELTITKTHTSYDDMYQLHDYTSDNYIVDRRNFAFKSTYIIASYHLTKDFNNAAESTKIRREKRIYNIPDNAIRRIIEIPRKYTLTTSVWPDEKKYIHKLILGAFIDDPKLLKVSNLTIYSDEIDGFGNIPTIGYASESAVYIKGECLDNYAINYYVDNKITKPLKYVDDTGRCKSVFVSLNSDFTEEFKKNEEKAKLLPNITQEDYKQDINTIGTVIVQKDPYEALSLSVNIDIVSGDEKLIIGAGLYKNSRIITDAPHKIYAQFSNFWSKSTKAAYHGKVPVQATMEGNKITFSGQGFGLENYYEIVDEQDRLLVRGECKNNILYVYGY